jgi:hypothetical protein
MLRKNDELTHFVMSGFKSDSDFLSRCSHRLDVLRLIGYKLISSVDLLRIPKSVGCGAGDQSRVVETKIKHIYAVQDCNIACEYLRNYIEMNNGDLFYVTSNIDYWDDLFDKKTIKGYFFKFTPKTT